jgi:hypothetical protein
MEKIAVIRGRCAIRLDVIEICTSIAIAPPISQIVLSTIF